ncbi:helix-turn-helix transcriptional regulator [Candidatus Poribacteria bacterium]|nr:helix-turn-helix transcriptional regulator [Candidatus Poribacteria bacterium]
MDLKKIEEQLLDFAEEIGGKEFVEELVMEHKNPQQNSEQDTEGTDPFEEDRFYLDSELIRVRIKECQLTLKQLHEQVGVSYRTVIRWLNNTEFPKHQNLVQLAEALQLEPHELVLRKMMGRRNMMEESLRFTQRSIESIVTEILNDEKMPKEKKVDALAKYYNILLKGKK